MPRLKKPNIAKPMIFRLTKPTAAKVRRHARKRKVTMTEVAEVKLSELP